MNNEKGSEAFLIASAVGIIVLSAVVIYKEYAQRKEIENDLRMRDSDRMYRKDGRTKSRSGNHRKS